MSVARSAGWADTAVLVMAVLAAAVTGNDAGVWPAVLVEHGRVSGALPAGGSNHYVSPSLLKLLPLGDSITWGCGDICSAGSKDKCDGGYGENATCCAAVFGKPIPHPWTPCFRCSDGYRGPLIRTLNRKAAAVGDGALTAMPMSTAPMVMPMLRAPRWTTVGTLAQENGARHDGHPGWRIDQLGNTTGGSSSFFANWTGMAPDAVLLMIGTNDIGQLFNTTCDRTVTPWKCDVTNMLGRLDGLVGRTLSAVPHTQVFLSDILGIGPKPCYGPDPQAIGNDMVLAFNAGLPAIAAKHGDRVTHVPLLKDTGIGEDGDGLCPCQYHPTHASYARIAAIFAAAIASKFI